MTTPQVYLAEIVVYDPSLPGTRTLRYATRGFVTGPAETPANTFYDERLSQPAALKRDIFSAGTTQGASRVGYGDLLLLNGDGALDALRDYGVDGRVLTIRKGLPGAAYPSGFPIDFVGTMDTAEFSATAVTIKLRDRQAELAVPLQANKYAGTNALPAGLEGVATDLKGKPKPLCFGSVSSITAAPVNTSKLIYQVHDGAVASVPAVYDRGLALGSSLWVAAGGGATTKLSTSADGLVWGLSPTVSVIAAGACPGLTGKIVFVDTIGQVWVSTTGDSWTATTIDFGFQPKAIAWSGSLYVAVGQLGQIWTSPDLTTWISRVSGFGTTNINAVVWDTINSQFVAVGDLSKVSTSPTGVTWTAQTTGATTFFRGVTVGAGLIVAVGSSASVYTSPTGVTWTSRTSAVTGTPALPSIVFGVQFVSGSADGQIMTSPDAITWTKQASVFPASAGCLALAYANGLYVCGGDNGLIQASPDGASWTTRASGYNPGAYQIRAIAFATGLGTDTYATLTDLSDDTKAPATGSFKVHLAGGYFRLGSSPAGTVTADVLEGTTAADRTAAQLFKRVLIKAGKVSADYSATDLTALDAQTSAVLGDFIDTETTPVQVLDRIAGTVGAWWGPDATGVFRIQRFDAPSGGPAISFAANDLLKPLESQATQDVGRGIPIYRVILRWGRIFTVQTTDVAGGVTTDRRAVIGKEWREASYTDATVQTAHLLAQQLDEDSLFQTAADALTEATRRQILRAVRRDRYPLLVELNAVTGALDLNNVPQLTHPRFGLSGGKLLRIIGLEPDVAARRLLITAWG